MRSALENMPLVVLVVVMVFLVLVIIRAVVGVPVPAGVLVVDGAVVPEEGPTHLVPEENPVQLMKVGFN